MRPRPFRHLRALGVCAAIAVGASLGALAPAALAAPANDTFANRLDLGDALPVHKTESNVGATREAGEPMLGSMGSAGHSIWWEWEAPATEWITVSTCQSPIPTVVAVFEGAELATLTRVAEGNYDEGPSCLYNGGKTWTFRAEAGHHYEIGADGNGFYIPVPPGDPEPPKPIVEGEITLTIEATPVPPNDDFEDATPIEHQIYEEPEGGRRFTDFVQGYDWGATTQPGEPDAAGEPGGASVWYSWIAPESGAATIEIAAGSTGILTVYTGGALDELTRVPTGPEALAAANVPVVEGTKYMIAVDAKRSEATGEPELGAFQLIVDQELKRGPGYPLEPPPSCACVGEHEPIAVPISVSPPQQTPTPHMPINLRVTRVKPRPHPARKKPKHRCTTHKKGHKAWVRHAHFTVPGRQRRHHSAG